MVNFYKHLVAESAKPKELLDSFPVLVLVEGLIIVADSELPIRFIRIHHSIH